MIVNGEEKQVEGISVYDLLIQEGYQTDRVVVELNLEILQKEDWKNIMVGNDDTMEVIRFVGGG